MLLPDAGALLEPCTGSTDVFYTWRAESHQPPHVHDAKFTIERSRLNNDWDGPEILHRTLLRRLRGSYRPERTFALAQRRHAQPT